MSTLQNILLLIIGTPIKMLQLIGILGDYLYQRVLKPIQQSVKDMK